MPAESFEKLLEGGAVSYYDKYRGVSVEGMAAFWNPSAQMALLFNSFVGGAAIMEYRDGILEASRVNDSFYETLGTTREDYLPFQTDILGLYDDENREILLRELLLAIDGGEERVCEVRNSHAGRVTREWTRCRMRLLVKNNERAILYFAIEDITERKRMEREQLAENERTRLFIQTTGTGFFDYDCASDTLIYQLYLPGEGAIKRKVPGCSKRGLSSELIHPDGVAALQRVIETASKRHVDDEIEFVADLWGRGMRWCRLRYASVEDASGRVYRIVGQTDDIQPQKDSEAISEAIRRRLNTDTPSYNFNDDVVNQIFGFFYGSSDIVGAIETTLALLGEYYNLSRVYLSEDLGSHAYAESTFEWPTAQAEFSRITYADIGGRDGFLSLFDGSGSFYCPDVALLSENNRAIFAARGVKSMLLCAIRDGGAFCGFLGFETSQDGIHWSDEQLGTLMFVSRIVGAFLLKLRESDSAAFSSDFRAALDDNAAFTYIIDPESYEIIYINKAIRAHASGEPVGKQCFREFIGSDSPCANCPLLNMNESGQYISEVHRPDGMYLLAQASPLRWNGRDMVMLSCLDITPGKEAELALAAERQKTLVALSATNLFLWTFDIRANKFIPSGRGALFNAEGKEIPGSYSAVVESGFVMPESVAEYIELHERIKRGEKAASAVIHFNPEGCIAEWMSVSYTNIFDESGAPAYAIALARDVSEER